jgi:hypothetical protein
MDEKLHHHFMLIMSEMVVMYYDHHFMGGIMRDSGTMRGFETFCDKVKGYMTDPPRRDAETAERSETFLIVWLVTELEVEFGLSQSLASEVVVSFFLGEYYRNVYTVQKIVNDYLFPNGYHNKLVGGL